MSRHPTTTRPSSPPGLAGAARAAYAVCHRLGRPELVTALLAEMDEELVSSPRKIIETSSSTFCPDEAYSLGTARDLLLARALFTLLGLPATSTVEEGEMNA